MPRITLAAAHTLDDDAAQAKRELIRTEIDADILSPDAVAFSAVTRIRTADGMRGLACLIVLLVHALAYSSATLAPWLGGAGKIGVWLFFVLSALLLTRRLNQQHFTRRSLFDYAIGRMLRILPAYAIAVLLYWRFGTAGIESWGDVLAALTLRRGYAHLWTVPVEFAFYGLLPLFAWALSVIHRRVSQGWMLVACTALILVQQALLPYWRTPPNSIDVFWYLPCFLCGSVAAFLLEDRRWQPNAHSADIVGGACLLLVVVSVPWMQRLLWGRVLIPIDDKFVYFGLLWALFVFTQARSTGILARALGSLALTTVGRASYSIYLMHWLIVLTILRHWPDNVSACVAAIALSIAAGQLGWWLVERPSEMLRRRIARVL